ncbi:hypothetical protein EH223_18220 [candidate division KSB1 bacterium]|nr:peptidylprolyl isomerase [candidate division KSB1 bacterium]RQW00680.1 MAG: hypothetical protein EH223_18220 [candidate division KSB1 bacterium]
MKIFAKFFICILLFGIHGQGQELLDRIVAIVDDEIILESEVTQMAWLMTAQLGIDPSKNQEKFMEFRKIAAQNIVTKELLVIQADKDTIEAEERQIEAYLEQQMQTAIQQAGGQEKLEEVFGMPLSRIRRNYREDIEKELRAKAVQDQKLMNVSVNRREVKDFYRTMKDSLGRRNETIDISHIIIEAKPGEKARIEAMEKAINIRKRLLDGEDFAELARTTSDDQASAQRGGDLGFMAREDFVREYAEAAFALQPGEISDIVESQFGFHIIKLEEKRGEKIHTRHILISIKPTQEDQIAAAEKIKSIHGQLVNGADFVEMVEQYSDDASTKNDRGHLGTFEVDQLRSMAKEFVFALDDVEVGEISEPVKTEYGFHILKLNSREDAREIDFDKDYDQIQEMALQYKKQQELKKWIDQMKKEIYIEYKDESLM